MICSILWWTGGWSSLAVLVSVTVMQQQREWMGPSLLNGPLFVLLATPWFCSRFQFQAIERLFWGKNKELENEKLERRLYLGRYFTTGTLVLTPFCSIVRKSAIPTEKSSPLNSVIAFQEGKKAVWSITVSVSSHPGDEERGTGVGGGRDRQPVYFLIWGTIVNWNFSFWIHQ